MKCICPVCGSKLATVPPISVLELIPLSPQEKTILGELVDSYPKSLKVKKLIHALYWQDPDGGPVTANHVVHGIVSRLRKRLPDFGWTIGNNVGGRERHGEYRLQPITEGK